MSQPAYMAEPWFAMLIAAIRRTSQSEVARLMGRSPSLINQIEHAGGNYGKGTASTERIAQRVLDTFGSWPCPYLGDGEAERLISAEQCRTYAHRDAPTSAPGDLAHWRACRTCDMRGHSAPPAPRVVVPRGRRIPINPAPAAHITPTAIPGESHEPA